MDVVIFDGHGYWVARRRTEAGVVDMWSPHKKDAGRFHFLQVAQRIAERLPQKVEFLPG